MIRRLEAGLCVLCLLFCINIVHADAVDSALSAYETVDALENLYDYTGFDIQKINAANLSGISTESVFITGLGDGSSKNVEYRLDFGRGRAETLTITCEVRVSGKIRLYLDCHSGPLLQEYTIPQPDPQQIQTEQSYTFVLGDTFRSLDGIHTVAMAFDNNMKFLLKNFEFSQGEIQSAYDTVRAINCSDKSDDLALTEYVENPQPGSWLCYKNLDFDQGLSAVTLTYASLFAKPAKVYFRTDSSTGPVFATINYCSSTGASNRFKAIQAEDVQHVSGIHDVYITFDSTFGRINSFACTPESPIAADETGLNAGNFSEKDDAVEIQAGQFLLPSGETAWIAWENVDFGDIQRLWTAMVQYDPQISNKNAVVQIRLDAPDGEIVAQGFLGDGGIAQIPVTTSIQGVHTVYVTLESGSGHAALCEILFQPGDAPVISCTPIGDLDAPTAYQVQFVFLEQKGTRNLFVAAALYNADGRIIGVVADYIISANGVNVASVTVPCTESTIQAKTLKGFLWESGKNTPLCPAGKFDLKTLEAI